jgi:hypothetical protein
VAGSSSSRQHRQQLLGRLQLTGLLVTSLLQIGLQLQQQTKAQQQQQELLASLPHPLQQARQQVARLLLVLQQAQVQAAFPPHLLRPLQLLQEAVTEPRMLLALAVLQRQHSPMSSKAAGTIMMRRYALQQ